MADRYWSLVWKKARELEGGNWLRKTLVDVLIMVLSVVVLGAFLGYDTVFSNRWLTISLALVGMVGTFLHVFLLHLVKAPVAIHREQLDKYAAMEKDHDAILSTLTSLQQTANDRVASVAEVKDILYCLFVTGHSMQQQEPSKAGDEWLAEVSHFVQIALSKEKLANFLATTKRPTNNNENVAWRKEVSLKAQWVCETQHRLDSSDINPRCTVSKLARWKLVAAH